MTTLRTVAELDAAGLIRLGEAATLEPVAGRYAIALFSSAYSLWAAGVLHWAVRSIRMYYN